MKKYLDFTGFGAYSYSYTRIGLAAYWEYHGIDWESSPLGIALSQLLPANLFKMWGDEEPWVKDVPHKHDYYVTLEIKRNRN